MNIITEIFDALMVGNSSVITTENIRAINEIAIDLYYKPQLNTDEIETFKKIIMICNVLYNRTDMTVLPVEDGFYDLLLEKYKTYDEHFQVGSAVVEFRNFVENDIELSKKIAKPAVVFMDKVDRDETHQYIYDKIIRKGEPILNQDDFRPAPPLSTGTITKRTHNTAHNHPTLVGTLDKCKFVLNIDAIAAGVFNDPNVKVLERDFFRKHIEEGIIRETDEIEVVVELKYDGISVEADCKNYVISARTRGDTGIGEASDITPILYNYPFNHADVLNEVVNPIGVKFEAIMTKENLYKFNQIRGRSYANCRSAIVGLFGASDAYLFRDMITLVPLAIDRDDVPAIENRMQEIEFLNQVFVSHGQPLRYCYFKGSITEVLFLIKAFWDEAKVARDYLDFMYDGIVVSYLDENIRNKLGRKNYINKFSMAVKFDALEKQTIFRGYTYEVGQHGSITPMIHYDPVEFLGTIHNKSTGSSFKRFQELGLKYGDIINVEYRNDVMPYVSRVECEANRNNPNPVVDFITTCPICGTPLQFTDSGKTAICPNNDCPGRSIQRMVNMFAKLNIKGFADASFKALGKTHLYELADIPLDQLQIILGVADGEKFFYEFNKLVMEPQKDYIVMGALGFTSIAYKKWRTILERVTIKNLQEMYERSNGNLNLFANQIYSAAGNIGTVTLQTIVNEWEFFVKDINFILSHMQIVDSFGTSNADQVSVRFSGFRNQQLVELLNNLGFDADDNQGVTKDTNILLIPVDGFQSTKVQKANKYGVPVITLDQFLKENKISL